MNVYIIPQDSQQHCHMDGHTPPMQCLLYAHTIKNLKNYALKYLSSQLLGLFCNTI